MTCLCGVAFSDCPICGAVSAVGGLGVWRGWVVVPAGPVSLPAGAVAAAVGASTRSPSGAALRIVFTTWAGAAAFAAAWAVWGVRAALLPAVARQFTKGSWAVSVPAVQLGKSNGSV